jgi:hypothetical protein
MGVKEKVEIHYQKTKEIERKTGYEAHSEAAEKRIAHLQERMKTTKVL